MPCPRNNIYNLYIIFHLNCSLKEAFTTMLQKPLNKDATTVNQRDPASADNELIICRVPAIFIPAILPLAFGSVQFIDAQFSFRAFPFSVVLDDHSLCIA